MRISDWSSDVCSSDLAGDPRQPHRHGVPGTDDLAEPVAQHRAAGQRGAAAAQEDEPHGGPRPHPGTADRKSAASRKRVSVRVGLSGRSIIKKKNNINYTTSDGTVHNTEHK